MASISHLLARCMSTAATFGVRQLALSPTSQVARRISTAVPCGVRQLSVRELLRVRDAEDGQRSVLDAATLRTSANAGEAIDKLLDQSLSGLVVLGEGSSVMGLVTERELLRFAGSRDTGVEDAMIPLRDLYCVSPSDSVKTCIDLCMARVFLRPPALPAREVQRGIGFALTARPPS